MTCLCGLPVNLVPGRVGYRWICPTCGPRDREQLTPANPKENQR